jgi:hypothetical protein
LGFVSVVCFAACGNYSNEDLDFQLALPQQSDIGANTQLAKARVNSAEYYRDTRNAITTFNTMVTDLLGLIEHVRGYPATSRQGNRRIWGPFPDKYPTWQIRVVMDRSSVSQTLLHMDYWVQVRPVGTDDSAWVSFLAGSYSSSGSARTGTGDIHLLASDARDATYPVDDDPGLAELDHLDVHYENTAYPLRVTMTIVNLPKASTRSGIYDYSENQDGSGSMTFDWQGTTDAGVSIAAKMKAQWLGSGAGRADVTGHLTANTSGSATLLGTDCWGVDTVASYSFRAGQTSAPPLNDPAACLF